MTSFARSVSTSGDEFAAPLVRDHKHLDHSVGCGVGEARADRLKLRGRSRGAGLAHPSPRTRSGAVQVPRPARDETASGTGRSRSDVGQKMSDGVGPRFPDGLEPFGSPAVVCPGERSGRGESWEEPDDGVAGDQGQEQPASRANPDTDPITNCAGVRLEPVCASQTASRRGAAARGRRWKRGAVPSMSAAMR